MSASDTKRPVNPAAEEILGGYFPVLDHGFVALVDYMGTDESVERAARVSYGQGTRKRSETRALLRYLRRHRHTTPSEMVELQFHCAMPVFVARQWIRHRTACLAEGTEVWFDLAGGIRRQGRQPYTLCIEEIWERLQARNGTRPDEQRSPHFRRDVVRRMRLRQLDEDTLRLCHTRVVDVFRNGRKPVFRMRLSDGKAIEATRDHRFLFADGWKTLHEATGLHERSGVAIWKESDYYVHVNGSSAEAPALYEDAQERELAFVERQGGPPIRAEWVPRPRIGWDRMTRARLARVEAFEYVGEKETFDLEVAGPHHNFIANGIVTHNSVNELSGRYSLMPLLFYRPARENFALQSTANRQGRGADAAPAELHREAVRRWEDVRTAAAGAYAWLVGHDVARELARIDLPLSTYTQWYWKIDLHNLMHFLSLRVEDHAQWEIREYARVIAGILKRVAPLSYQAWIDYDLTGRRFSGAELDVLRHFLRASESGISPREGREALSAAALQEFGLSPREARELIAKLQPPDRPDFELDLSRMRSAAEVESEMRLAVPERLT